MQQINMARNSAARTASYNSILATCHKISQLRLGYMSLSSRQPLLPVFASAPRHCPCPLSLPLAIEEQRTSFAGTEATECAAKKVDTFCERDCTKCCPKMLQETSGESCRQLLANKSNELRLNTMRLEWVLISKFAVDALAH